MKTLYIDCFSGLAGDMMLGALLDLGLPKDHLESELAKLGVEGWSLEIARALRHGISGVDVHVQVAHDHHAPHRHFSDIRTLIQDSGLTDSAKALSLAMFERLAAAEGALHAQDPETVHFHEVGGIDAIVDLCGVAVGMQWLSVDQVICAPVPVPRGWVKCAHGTMPLPAPATLELLRGAQTQSVDASGEWVTPTGAAILAGLNVTYGPIPAFVVNGIGYGVGDANPDDRPNLLRLIVGESKAEVGADSHDILIEANIDDMTPESFAYVSERLFAAGAYDVWTTPIHMKKGRSAFTLSVLCDVQQRPSVIDRLLTESTTIGVRMTRVERYKLAYECKTVDTELGPVRVKVARDGNRTVNMAPEFEDCRRLADEHGLPLKIVVQTVQKALIHE